MRLIDPQTRRSLAPNQRTHGNYSTLARWGTFALVASLTVACAEGDAERSFKPEAPETPEGSESESLDASSAAESDASTADALVWEACGPGRCATLEVPVDYADPDGERLPLRFFVGPARTPRARSGALMFNPGGPGVAVTALAEDLYDVLSSLFPTLDIVFLDNRGIGQSVPIDCVDSDYFDRLEIEPAEDAADAMFDDETLNLLSEFWDGFHRGCEDRMGSQLLSNLHTENVARDMDRVRQALGDPQLNLWAISYGTVQGALYAKLFPEHVRAFVLEAPVFRGTLDLIEDSRVSAASYDRELGRVFEWCTENDRCGLGGSVAEVEAGYDALQEQLDTGVEDDAGDALDASILFSALQFWLLSGDWESIAEAFAAAVMGDWAPLAAGAEVNVLGEDEAADFAATQANIVIQAMDYGCPADYTTERAKRDLEALFDDYPRTAVIGLASITLCSSWSTVASEARVHPSEVSAQPLLLLAGANDPATPIEGARSLVEQLGNDSRLLVSEVEGHGTVGLDEAATLAFLDFIDAGQLVSAGIGCAVPPCVERARLVAPPRRPQRSPLPHPIRLPRQLTELGMRMLRSQ